LTIQEANQWWLWLNTVLLVVGQGAMMAYQRWAQLVIRRRADEQEEMLKVELARREALRIEYQKDMSAGMQVVVDQTNGNAHELRELLKATLDRLDHVVKDRDYFRDQNRELMERVIALVPSKESNQKQS
jgi:enamine deaminase RidA (YjgF/YER057c/UK114 family)